MDGEHIYEDFEEDHKIEVDEENGFGYSEDDHDEEDEKQRYLDYFWRNNESGWPYSDDD